jgi:hypothetical protein
MRGEPVSGFAFYERSLALYRDWELIEVLASAVDDEELVGELRTLVASGKRPEARKLLQSMPAAGDSDHARDVVNALIEVLSSDG